MLELPGDTIGMAPRRHQHEWREAGQRCQRGNRPRPWSVQPQIVVTLDLTQARSSDLGGDLGCETGPDQDLGFGNPVSLGQPVPLPPERLAASREHQIAVEAVVALGYIQERTVQIEEDRRLHRSCLDPKPFPAVGVGAAPSPFTVESLPQGNVALPPEQSPGKPWIEMHRFEL